MGRYSIVATYTVRIALHRRPDPSPGHTGLEGLGSPVTSSAPAPEPPEPPTAEELERLIEDKLYNDLPYFGPNEIGIRAERTDR